MSFNQHGRFPPGLFGAELIAAAMPDRVLSVESMVMDEVAPPTEICRVPVPTVELALAMGCEVSDEAVARFWTSREY